MVWLRQSRATLRDKVKTIKELDTQIVDMLSASKEENVDEQVVKEIKESDETIAEFERTLLEIDDALKKLVEQSVPLLTPTQPKAAEQSLDDSQVSSSSVGKVTRAKLPKLHLRNFSGKICEWPEFWIDFPAQSTTMTNCLTSTSSHIYAVTWKGLRSLLSQVCFQPELITSEPWTF